MKILLLHPPLVINSMPMAGISALSGFMKHLGQETKVFDLNNEFYNYCLNKSFFEKLHLIYQKLSASNDSDLQELFYILKKYQSSDKNFYLFCANNIESLIEVFQTEKFYNIYNLMPNSKNLGYVINLVSSLFEYCLSNNVKKEFNVFYDFINRMNKRIKDFKPDLIGISIEDKEQKNIAQGLIKKLKDKKTPLIIGGADITFNKKEYLNLFKNNKDIDYMIFGDGEEAWEKIIQSCIESGKINPSQVPSLIYKNKKEIIENKLSVKAYKKIYYWDFSYVDFKKYYSPVPVLPVESSRNCYWGKCYFCNFHKGNIYYEKTPERLVKEIEYYQKTYNTDIYQFVDLAVSPHFLDTFADLLIKKKLNIRYSLFLRCEAEFTDEMMKKAYESGLRVIFWGIETGSDKLLKTMNKGTTIANMNAAINNAAVNDIVNCGFLMYGIPTETNEDLRLLIEFLQNSKLDKIIIDKYFLAEDSYIDKHREEFGLDANAEYTDISFYAHRRRNTLEQEKMLMQICHCLNSKKILPPASMMTEILLYAALD